MQSVFFIPFARLAWGLVLTLALACTSSGQESKPVGAPAAEDATLEFHRDVLPILEKYCTACHSEGDAGGGLELDSFAGLVRGGEHGIAVTAGVPTSSRMLQVIIGGIEPKMPPDDLEAPSELEIEILEAWVEQGANADGAVMRSATLVTPDIPPASDLPPPITALASSADGRLLAVAGYEFVELRDSDNLDVQHRIESLPGKVNDLAFSPDGRFLVAASGVTGLRGVATLIDVTTGDSIRTFEGHRDVMFSVAVSPDSKWIATTSFDQTVLLWDASTGELLQTIKGHNGAVLDVAFSHDGKVLATASADETVKLWKVEDGERLDTLAQPQGEVWAVAFGPEDQWIVAASSDQQIRVWDFLSRSESAINPLLVTRYADESPLVDVIVDAAGGHLLAASQAGNVSVFETSHWNKTGELEPLKTTVSHFAHASRSGTFFLATLDGRIEQRGLAEASVATTEVQASLDPVFLQMDRLEEVDAGEGAHQGSPADALRLSRGAIVKGTIQADESGASTPNWYRFRARRGEVWMVEINAARSKSPLDSLVEVCDQEGDSLTRVRLQALLASYFTFRGKDSNQSADFRLFDWEQMRLNDLLYSSGEVTRLWMYPRGPDSGFNVYPGTGARTTYFDTSGVTHALQEPAYVVRPLGPGETPVANGLPVFDVPFVNDDDATRAWGTDSRLQFTAPRDGWFCIKVDDTRGLGGEDYVYTLTLRPASPGFDASVAKIKKPLFASAGREFRVSVTRKDGYDGPVTFEFPELPTGLHVSGPIVVESGQKEAYGTVYVDESIGAGHVFPAIQVVARAKILGKLVEKRVGDLGELKVADGQPQVALVIEDLDGNRFRDSQEPISVRRGTTLQARIIAKRNAFENDLSLGKEFAGRNLPHGAYVDNIGLNGLLIPKGQLERQFFITVDAVTAPGPRVFHLKAEIDGGLTSLPLMLEVLE